MSTINSATCCGLPDDHPRDSTSETHRLLRNAIAFGDDLGGVFELSALLKEARRVIRDDGDEDSIEADIAAAAVGGALRQVADAFASIEGRRDLCPSCELRQQLDQLIDSAAKAIADHREGVAAPGAAKVVTACAELALYAGDHHPDENATREALGRARDAFLATAAAISPELR